MKFIINWTDFANQDLNDIIDYMIDNGDINNAKNIYLKIKVRCVLLELNPNQGRIVPEFEKLSIIKYREIIVKPWRIIYKVEKNAIYILVEIDGRRNTKEILLEKITKNRA